MGKKIFDVFPFIEEKVRKEYEQVFATGRSLITDEHNEFEGITIYTESTKLPVIEEGKVEKIITIIRDVTEKKLADQKLKESEEKFRMISEQSLMGICIIQDGIIKYANKQLAGLSEFSVEEMQSWSPGGFAMFIHPEFREFVIEQARKKQLGEKGAVDNYIVKIITKSKKEKWINLFSKTIYYEGRLADLATIVDITEQKKAEEALVASEETYRNLFQNAQVGISRTGIYDGKILECNDQLAKMFGFESREKFMRDCNIVEQYINPEDRKTLIKKIEKNGEARNFEAQFYRKDSSVIWIRFSGKINEEKGWIEGVAEDITEMKKAEEETKKLEEQLFQSQKMESIGRLAGGIAHDFNNILTSVMGYAEMLKMKYKDPEKGSGKAADIIFKGSQRAANLTKQLLGFARGGKYNPEPLNVNNVIRDTVSVSEKIFEKNIDVKFDFKKDINTIDADKNQLGQVITNLIINAKDAMPSGGELIISTENAFLDKTYTSKYPEILVGNYVKISVTDTGIGMVKEVKDRIFEPFFTTKGKGTGLGLATVYGIIKNHKGHINCYSEPGEGTTFNVYLPVSESEIVQKIDKNNILTGHEKILVIDDEESLRKLLSDQLEDLGYNVLSAADGKEGVDIYKDNINEIDLVLLDMIMPGMSGKQAFDALKKLNPDVKVLLISGYSQNGKAKKILSDGALGFLQKPFNLQQLSEIIHDALKS